MEFAIEGLVAEEYRKRKEWERKSLWGYIGYALKRNIKGVAILLQPKTNSQGLKGEVTWT